MRGRPALPMGGIPGPATGNQQPAINPTGQYL
jgi:hypothetical protein